MAIVLLKLLMVKTELRGKALAFIPFKITMHTVSMPPDVLQVSADPVFNTGIDSKTEFCGGAEINE